MHTVNHLQKAFIRKANSKDGWLDMITCNTFVQEYVDVVTLLMLEVAALQEFYLNCGVRNQGRII